MLLQYAMIEDDSSDNHQNLLNISFPFQEKLDQELQRRQARETGICPIREELYAQVSLMF